MLPDRKHRQPVQFGPYCSYHGGFRSPSAIKWLVIHDTEGKGYPTQPSAKGVASWGASSGATASWHFTVDDDILIRCLADDQVAYAAFSPANEIGLHVELCGFAKWTKKLWFFHQDSLKRAAWQYARWCRLYKIPPRFLTDKQIANREKGLVQHRDISRVITGDHQDPGPWFPKAYFLFLIKRRIKWLEQEAR